MSVYTKKCNQCGNVLEVNRENFQPYKGRSVDGFRAICRICERSNVRTRMRAKAAAKREEKATA